MLQGWPIRLACQVPGGTSAAQRSRRSAPSLVRLRPQLRSTVPLMVSVVSHGGNRNLCHLLRDLPDHTVGVAHVR